jgi:hypothetical protein
MTYLRRFITCGLVGTGSAVFVLKLASAVNRSAEDTDWRNNAYYHSINPFD